VHLDLLERACRQDPPCQEVQGVSPPRRPWGRVLFSCAEYQAGKSVNLAAVARHLCQREQASPAASLLARPPVLLWERAHHPQWAPLSEPPLLLLAATAAQMQAIVVRHAAAAKVGQALKLVRLHPPQNALAVMMERMHLERSALQGLLEQASPLAMQPLQLEVAWTLEMHQ